MSNKDPKDPKALSRRDLLTFWRRPLAELKEGATAKPRSAPAPVVTRKPPLRPPGMMHELMLQNACIRCGKCVEVCPAEAIHPLGPDWGRAAGTPFIDARKQPCVLCTGLQCTHVCPSGALIPVYVPNDVTMGLAHLDRARCTPWATGQPCGKCVEKCPIPGALTADAEGRPVIDDEKCVGCGLCEHVCPTEPASVAVTPRD